MRIGIDLRMAGTGEGIGRYVEELVVNLSKQDRENQYFLFFQDPFARKSFPLHAPNFEKILTASLYYSLAEQVKFPRELARFKLDLMHFTNFNFPIFYRGKFVVTIHDLIHHFFPGKKKSRFFHRLAYRVVFCKAVRGASKIIAVSKNTANQIAQKFDIPKKKIATIYEGVNDKFFQSLPADEVLSVKKKYQLNKPYFLAVGVWRQYKNYPLLAQAFMDFKKETGLDYLLAIGGKIDPYYPEIGKAVTSQGGPEDIKALGYVPEDDLLALYRGAEIFVLPSLLEGFGLIALEAQASGAPVIASDIPVLREVLRDSAVFFPPRDSSRLQYCMAELARNPELRKKLSEAGLQNVQKFQWEQTAAETLNLYRETVNL